MDDRFRVRLKLNKSQFSAAIRSILPEVGAVEGRSREWIEEDSQNFYFYIGAADTVALRASLGTFTRLIVMIEKLNMEVK